MFFDDFKNYLLIQQDALVHFPVDDDGAPEGGIDFLLDVPSKVFIMPRLLWIDTLSLADDAGWVRKGTGHPNHFFQQHCGQNYFEGHWDQNYTSRDFQLVEKDDAQGLADAIEKTVPRIGAAVFKQERERVFSSMLKQGMELRRPGALSLLIESTDFEQLNLSLPDWRKRKQFVDFCRAGGFYIIGRLGQ